MDPRSLFRWFSVVMVACCLVGFGVGCDGSSTDQGKDLSVELTVDISSGVAVVDTFSFGFEVRGRALHSMVLDYGDGESETVQGGASSRIFGNRVHAYQEAGTFRAVALARELAGQESADTAVVQVQ